MQHTTCTKWVACWGNATSISDRHEATYGRDLTLRYPIPMCFDGSSLRLHFSNLTGTEPVRISACRLAKNHPGEEMKREVDPATTAAVTFAGLESCEIAPGCEITSDPITYPVTRGECVCVSLYLGGFVQLSSGTLVTGPLSHGYYAYGNHCEAADLPDDLSRNTNWFYFLNTVDVLTEECNRALICYGDSITAQNWPDDLTLRCRRDGFVHTAIIRRAVCGTRILRQYDCITYQAYGLKGSTRFPIEMQAAGADAIILQHGINDIIHPVGTEINRFRPMSDLPTAGELYAGFTQLYVQPAKAAGMQVWGGTLLPIYGWRTYAPFREELRCAFNEILQHDQALDGVIDFAAAVCDQADPRAFAPGCDSGDHLHPSKVAYQRMAEAVPAALLLGK